MQTDPTIYTLSIKEVALCYMLGCLMWSACCINVLLICSVLRNKKMRTVANGLLLQVAGADCLTSGIVGTVVLLNANQGYMQQNTQNNYQAACSVGVIFLSVQSLMLIALHRHSVVVNGLGWSARQAMYRSIPCYTSSLALMSFSYYHVNAYSVQAGRLISAYTWSENSGIDLLPALWAVGIFTISLFIIIACYYRIFAFVAKAARQLQDSLHARKQASVTQKNQSKEVALAKRMLIIVSAFVACWSLYIFMILYCMISGHEPPAELDQAASITGSAYCLVNAVLCIVLDEKIRYSIIDLICLREPGTTASIPKQHALQVHAHVQPGMGVQISSIKVSETRATQDSVKRQTWTSQTQTIVEELKVDSNDTHELA